MSGTFGGKGFVGESADGKPPGQGFRILTVDFETKGTIAALKNVNAPRAIVGFDGANNQLAQGLLFGGVGGLRSFRGVGRVVRRF